MVCNRKIIIWKLQMVEWIMFIHTIDNYAAIKKRLHCIYRKIHNIINNKNVK